MVTTATRSGETKWATRLSRGSNAGVETPQSKMKRAAAKKAKPSMKANRSKNPASKLKADRSNKKAEVIALMKRAKGVTLAEIPPNGRHIRSAFVSILGNKGGEKIESSKSVDGERTYKIAK